MGSSGRDRWKGRCQQMDGVGDGLAGGAEAHRQQTQTSNSPQGAQNALESVYGIMGGAILRTLPVHGQQLEEGL